MDILKQKTTKFVNHVVNNVKLVKIQLHIVQVAKIVIILESINLILQILAHAFRDIMKKSKILIIIVRVVVINVKLVNKDIIFVKLVQ